MLQFIRVIFANTRAILKHLVIKIAAPCQFDMGDKAPSRLVFGLLCFKHAFIVPIIKTTDDYLVFTNMYFFKILQNINTDAFFANITNAFQIFSCKFFLLKTLCE